MASAENTSVDTPHDTQPLDNTSLFRQLDAYDWDHDAEFQGGLRAILGAVQNPEQVQHLTLRAKCYYFARKAGAAVDFNGYKDWIEHGGHEEMHEASTNGTTPHSGEANHSHQSNTSIDQILASADEATTHDGLTEPPRPASFAEICDMIAQGKPIPGIKDIPDTILEGQASESQASTRKKPWEKDAGAEESPSWMSA